MDEPRTEAGRWLLAIDHEPKGPCFDSPRCDCGQAIAAIERESLRLARDAVAGLPYSNGGHMDRNWSDALGTVETYHECHTSGLTHADVLAAIDRLMEDPKVIRLSSDGETVE